MWKFRQALITAQVIKLLVFCQHMGCSISRGQKEHVLSWQYTDAGCGMLGWGEDRLIVFPSWKVNSLNESTDVEIVFAFSLWQSCHSEKDGHCGNEVISHSSTCKIWPAFCLLLHCTSCLFKHAFVCCSAALPSVQLRWLLAWSF